MCPFGHILPKGASQESFVLFAPNEAFVGFASLKRFPFTAKDKKAKQDASLLCLKAFFLYPTKWDTARRRQLCASLRLAMSHFVG